MPRAACPNCDYVFYDNPAPVVAALVEHEGDVILARNKGWPDTWYDMENPTPAQPIWRRPLTLAGLNAWGRVNMVDYLDITFTEVGDDYLKATMPVDHRTTQPLGLLHGGASVVLAETLGSTAGTLCVDVEQQYCVGIEINANHLRAVREGVVTGTARPLHVGRRTHVWQIHIHDEQDRLVAVSRLTLAVLDR